MSELSEKENVFSSFIEFKKQMYPKLYQKELEAKKTIKEQLWEILISGIEEMKEITEELSNSDKSQFHS